MNFTIESAESESDFELPDVSNLFEDIEPQPVSTSGPLWFQYSGKHKKNRMQWKL